MQATRGLRELLELNRRVRLQAFPVLLLSRYRPVLSPSRCMLPEPVLRMEREFFAASYSELLEVVIDVPVAEHAPCPRGHFSPRGMFGPLHVAVTRCEVLDLAAQIGDS